MSDRIRSDDTVPPYERHFSLDGQLQCAILAPLSLERAVGALAWQPELEAAAKLALAGPARPDLPLCAAIHAEVPRALDDATSRKLAAEALAAAVDALERGGPSSTVAASAGAPVETVETAEVDDSAARREEHDVEELETALGQLPWTHRRNADGRYQLYASLHAGTAARIEVIPGARGLRASTSSAVRSSTSTVRAALGVLALECNRRLRLARISVVPKGPDEIRLIWDAFIPNAIAAQHAVDPLVESVAHAHALTRRSLAAISDTRVADLYLRARSFAVASEDAVHSREDHIAKS